MKNKLSKRTTIYDVAQKAGLSIATVSRVMNNADNVNEHTRLKILKLLDETSYKPKVVKNRIPCIGVLLEAEGLGINLFNNYNTAILSGVSDYVFKHGLGLSVFPFSGRAIRHPDDMMRHLQERGINGVAIIYREDYNASLNSLHLNRFPHFSIGGGTVVTPHAVSYEEEKAVELAIDYLMSLGHRRIWFVSVDYNNNSPMRRLSAFRDISRSHGCSESERLVLTIPYHPFYKRLGYETVMAFKEQFMNHPPDALICTDDNMAVGALKALDEIRLTVPEDLSLIGFNDSDFSEYTHPPLSMVAHPFYEIGYYAAESINCWLNRGEPTEEKGKSFMPKLIIRKSCVAIGNDSKK